MPQGSKEAGEYKGKNEFPARLLPQQDDQPTHPPRGHIPSLESMVKAFLHVVVIILLPGCSSPFLEDEAAGPLILFLKRSLVIPMSQRGSSGSLISRPLDRLPHGVLSSRP